MGQFFFSNPIFLPFFFWFCFWGRGLKNSRKKKKKVSGPPGKKNLVWAPFFWPGEVGTIIWALIPKANFFNFLTLPLGKKKNFGGEQKKKVFILFGKKKEINIRPQEKIIKAKRA